MFVLSSLFGFGALLASVVSAQYSLNVPDTIDLDPDQAAPNITVGLNWTPKNTVDVYFYSDFISVGDCKTTLPAGSTSFAVPFEGFSYTDHGGNISIMAVEQGSCNKATGTVDMTIWTGFSCSRNFNFLNRIVDPKLGTDGMFTAFTTSSPVITKSGSFEMQVRVKVSTENRVTQVALRFNNNTISFTPDMTSAPQCPPGLDCTFSEGSFYATVQDYFNLIIDTTGGPFRFLLYVTMKMKDSMGSGSCVPSNWGNAFKWYIPEGITTCPNLESADSCGVPPPTPAVYTLNVPDLISWDDMSTAPNINVGLSWTPKNPVDVYLYSDTISVGDCHKTIPANFTTLPIPFQGFSYSDHGGNIKVMVVEQGTCNKATGTVSLDYFTDFTCAPGRNFLGASVSPALNSDNKYLVFSSSPIQTATGLISLSMYAIVSHQKVIEVQMQFNGDRNVMSITPGMTSMPACPLGFDCNFDGVAFQLSVTEYLFVEVDLFDDYLDYQLVMTMKMKDHMSSGSCVPSDWGNAFKWYIPEGITTCPALDSVGSCRLATPPSTPSPRINP